MASTQPVRQPASHPDIPSGRTVIILLAVTAAATAAVITGVILMGVAAGMDPPLLPPATQDHRPVVAHPDRYLELYLHAKRLGDQEEASYPAAVRVKDIKRGSMDRMLGDAAARRGWFRHRENMLVLPASDLPELERAAADLAGWLIQDAARGGEPRPPREGALVNARLEITETGGQREWMLIGSVMTGVFGGAVCFVLLVLSATETRDYLRRRARPQGRV